jgi:hypothetical protein
MPSIARTKEVVMKVATLAGEPLSVDDLSLIKTGPVMVKINCRDPYKLRGFVKIFFNKMGYEIKFVLEKYEDKSNLPPCLPHKHQDHMEEEDNDDSEDEDSDMKHKKGSGKEHVEQGKLFCSEAGKSSDSRAQKEVVEMDLDNLQETYSDGTPSEGVLKVVEKDFVKSGARDTINIHDVVEMVAMSEMVNVATKAVAVEEINPADLSLDAATKHHLTQ